MALRSLVKTTCLHAKSTKKHAFLRFATSISNNSQPTTVKDTLIKFFVMDVDGNRFPITGRIGQTLVEACELNDVDLIQCDAHGGGSPSHIRHSDYYWEPVYGEGPQSNASHVILPKEWNDLVPVPSQQEEELLSFLEKRYNGSRLGCEIKITKQMEGLTLAVPERQDYLFEAN